MTFQSTTTLRHRSFGRLPLMSAAAGLVLVAGAVIGARMSAGVEQQTSTSAPVSAPLTSPVSAPRAGIGTGVDTGPGSTITLYLVTTAAEAATMQAAIDDADRHRSQFGLPQLSARVVLVETAEEGDALAATVTEWDAMRAGLGLAPVSVVDMRDR